MNIILLNKTKELVVLCESLGFSSTLFLEDINLVEAKTNGEILRGYKKGKFNIFIPKTEETLRFALEKSKIDLVYGMEKINYKDSMHYVRGGLDQVTCKIAFAKDKIIGFSFSDILNSEGKLLARMRLNIKLCKKYKVKMLFGNFSLRESEIRSAKDLNTFFRILGRS